MLCLHASRADKDENLGKGKERVSDCLLGKWFGGILYYSTFTYGGDSGASGVSYFSYRLVSFGNLLSILVSYVFAVHKSSSFCSPLSGHIIQPRQQEIIRHKFVRKLTWQAGSMRLDLNLKARKELGHPTCKRWRPNTNVTHTSTKQLSWWASMIGSSRRSEMRQDGRPQDGYIAGMAQGIPGDLVVHRGE